MMKKTKNSKKKEIKFSAKSVKRHWKSGMKR